MTRRRLFVGCRNPARLVVFDTEAGRRVGEGFVDIIVQKDVNLYERVERLPTAPGARTSYFSPELGQFFLAVPERGAQKVEIRIFEIK